MLDLKGALKTFPWTPHEPHRSPQQKFVTHEYAQSPPISSTKKRVGLMISSSHKQDISVPCGGQSAAR